MQKLTHMRPKTYPHAPAHAHDTSAHAYPAEKLKTATATATAAPVPLASPRRTPRGFKTYLLFFLSVLTCSFAWVYFFVPHGNTGSVPLLNSVFELSTKAPWAQEERQILPTTVTPSHYAIQLTPDFTEFKFQGEIVVDLKVNVPTKELKFNAVELEIAQERARVVTRAGASRLATAMTYDADRQEVTLTFADVIPKGTATLHLSFIGKHNDKMAGFYRSSYVDPNGNQKYMVVTQFESTDARRAFPCWDEPSLKATFDITLHVANEMTALSNMNEIEAKPHAKLPNYTTHRFATTPIMSTYLVAFVVGELEYIEKHASISNKLIPIRVYTTKGLKEQGEFALDCASKILPFFSKEFMLAYPLPKMDMVAVPDFSAGAMENWGLVTYRTVMLLVDGNNTSAASMQEVAYVVAHELAHQWFGNIVTMQWWDELWLNEGFATWVGWYAVDHAFPTWEVWAQFVASERGKALELDALRSSHAIQVPVRRPSEISQIFDSISYSKGASVIRMLATWLGTDRFVQGVALYLRRHQYGNAATEDLWDALNEASGKDVRSFMGLWTKQVGYPVLHVALDSPFALASGRAVPARQRKLRVRQERFLAGGSGSGSGRSNTAVDKFWWCPLGINALPGSMLTSGEQTFDVPAAPDANNAVSLLLNIGQSNFYRAHYAADLLAAFLQNANRLAEVDRAGLISDAFALSVNGAYSTVVALQFVQAEAQLHMSHYLRHEVRGAAERKPSHGRAMYEQDIFFASDVAATEDTPFSYVALREVSAGLSRMKEVWADEKVLPCLKQVVRDVFGPVVRRLGWTFTPADGHLHGLLRTLAVSAAGQSDDAGVVAQALAYVTEDVRLRQVHPNVRSAVYAIAVRHGDAALFKAVRDDVYGDESLPMDQRLSALASLGHVPRQAEVQTLLDFVLEHVRPQDWNYVLRTASLHHRLFVWRYLKTHWDKLEAAVSPAAVAKVVLLTSSWADTKLAETEIVTFFAQRNTAHYDRALQQTLEKIRMHEAWVLRDRAAVEAWMQEHCHIH